MSDDLRILIGVDLNRGLSIGEINKSLKAISKHPSLQKIKLHVEIDNKIIQSIQQFSNSLGKVNQLMGQQSSINNNVSSTTSKTTAEINRQTQAINQATKAQEKWNKEKVVTSKLADGEVTNIQTTYGKGNTKQIINTDADGGIKNITEVDNPLKDFQDAKKFAEAQKSFENFSNSTQSRLKEINKLIGNNNNLTNSLKEEFKSLNVESSKADFSGFENKLKALENYAKQESKAMKELDEVTSKIGNRDKDDRLKFDQATADARQKARLKEYEESVKLADRQAKIEKGYIQDIDRAHFEAFQEKEKRESHLGSKLIQDRVRANEMALAEDAKFNQQRFVNEQKFARMQQDTINKIETARMKYGHHKGVNENLDKVLYDTQQVTTKTKDWDNTLRNVNTQIAKSVTGLKAMRVESIGFVDGFKTAMVKFPIWINLKNSPLY